MFTQKRLRELVKYDPKTGLAFWRARRRGIKAGSRVGKILRGSKRSRPYRYFSCAEMGPHMVPFSHMAHFYMTGRWPAEEIDHANRDSLDDRWENIRESTRAQNEANRGARKNSKTGIKGVFLMKNGRFNAQIYRRGSHIFLGVFDTAQDAQAAYLATAAKYDGEFLRAA